MSPGLAEHQLQQELYRRANEEAERRGDSTIGLQHLLLALLDEASGSPARRALEGCGISYDLFTEALSDRSTDGPSETTTESVRGRFVHAEAARCLHRAEGFAAGLGSARTQPEHILISLVWDTLYSEVFSIVEQLGGSRRCLIPAMHSVGITLPSVPPPRRPRWSNFREVEEQEETLSELERLGTLYRLGYKDGRLLLSVAEGWEEATDLGY